jgi:hypothetical protein
VDVAVAVGLVVVMVLKVAGAFVEDDIVEVTVVVVAVVVEEAPVVAVGREVDALYETGLTTGTPVTTLVPADE